MALPAELERYDALIDVLVDALAREFEVDEETKKAGRSDVQNPALGSENGQYSKRR